MKQYLSLGNCMAGLNVITCRLFGITLEVVPTRPGETWHPDVYKVRAMHETGGLIGYVYLDLFARNRKVMHAANYALAFGHVEHSLPAFATEISTEEPPEPN